VNDAWARIKDTSMIVHDDTGTLQFIDQDQCMLPNGSAPK